MHYQKKIFHESQLSVIRSIVTNCVNSSHAHLERHAQTLVVISSLEFGREQSEMSTAFKLSRKIISKLGRLVGQMHISEESYKLRHKLYRAEKKAGYANFPYLGHFLSSIYVAKGLFWTRVP